MAQRVTITLPTVPSGIDSFTLEYSGDGAQTWTAYSPTDATPTGYQDPDALLSTGLLFGTTYTIDAINGGGGNAVAATATGLLYQARWHGTAGYTNPGPPFPVGAPAVSDAWAGLWAQCLQMLYEGGKALPLPDPVLRYGIAWEIPRVVAYIEGPPAPDDTGGTGRLITPTSGTREFWGGGAHRLRVKDRETNRGELVHPGYGGSAVTVTDIHDAPIAGTVKVSGAAAPWDELFLDWDGTGTLPRFPVAYVKISALWGLAAEIPPALMRAAAAEVYRLVVVGARAPITGLGNMVSVGSYSVSTAAAVSIWPKSSPVGVNDEYFQQVLKMYRDPLVLDTVRFGARTARTLRGLGA